MSGDVFGRHKSGVLRVPRGGEARMSLKCLQGTRRPPGQNRPARGVGGAVPESLRPRRPAPAPAPRGRTSSSAPGLHGPPQVFSHLCFFLSFMRTPIFFTIFFFQTGFHAESLTEAALRGSFCKPPPIISAGQPRKGRLPPQSRSRWGQNPLRGKQGFGAEARRCSPYCSLRGGTCP